MPESNKNNFSQALQDLPASPAPKHIWKNIEAHLALKEHLVALPEHAPPTVLWSRITEQLDDKAHLASALPRYKAPDYVWGNITRQLDKGKVQRLFTRWNIKQLKPMVSVAAIIVVLFSAGIFLFEFQDKKDYILSYSTENISLSEEFDVENESTFLSKSSELDEAINTHCAVQKQLCSNPAFKILQTNYADLHMAIEEMEQAKYNMKNDQEIMARYLLLQKEKAKISRKIMQFIHS